MTKLEFLDKLLSYFSITEAEVEVPHTTKGVTDYLGIHYSTVSRMVNKEM
jgi:DNA-directed RNA polymerase specialized sigma54-like protein